MSALTDATNTMPVGDEEPKKIVELVEETPALVEAVKTTEKTPEDAEASEEAEEAKETVEQKTARINELIISGRRFMKLSEYGQAAELFSEAAELTVEVFGEDQFDVTLRYGQSLLQLAKVEEEVLANALSGIPKAKDGDEEEEKEDGNVENADNVPEEECAEIRQQVEEALGMVEEKEDQETTPEAEIADTGSETMEQESAAEGTGEEKVEGEVEAKEGDAEGEAEKEAEGEEEEEEEDDGDDPMKLAWEVLETARCICEKKIREINPTDTESLKTWHLNHAEVLTSLGEHGFTDQKYDQSQADLLAAVTIQEAHLPPTSRLLANTHHLLGKAFILGTDYENAVEHFSKAKNILIAKVEELKGVEGEEEQIKELEELIPELDTLVVDAATSKEQYDKMKETAEEEMKEVKAVMAKFEGEEVKDISGMVRRKRPAEETKEVEVKEAGGKEEEGQGPKKQKTEDDPSEAKIQE